jgi:hypothetical protein
VPFNNVTGVYSPPAAATDAFAGKVIASADWNAIFTDISSGLTTLAQGLLVFGTGSSNAIAANSTNTGFSNQFLSTNSGTVSNAATEAKFVANLSGGSNTFAALSVLGGTNPSASLASGSGLTGGFTISAGAGTLSLTAPNIGVATGTSLSITGTHISQSGTATTAGGSTAAIQTYGSAGIGFYFGSGAPTISAVQGSFYFRQDGGAATALYINTTGSTTWVAVT